MFNMWSYFLPSFLWDYPPVIPPNDILPSCYSSLRVESYPVTAPEKRTWATTIHDFLWYFDSQRKVCFTNVSRFKRRHLPLQQIEHRGKLHKPPSACLACYRFNREVVLTPQPPVERKNPPRTSKIMFQFAYRSQRWAYTTQNTPEKVVPNVLYWNPSIHSINLPCRSVDELPIIYEEMYAELDGLYSFSDSETEYEPSSITSSDNE
jgi:hypothetical protein